MIRLTRNELLGHIFVIGLNFYVKIFFRRINEAEGRAQEILIVAEATAEGIRKVAHALNEAGGRDAANLEVAKKYVEQFGNLAKEGNTLIVPATLTDIPSMVATVMATLETGKK